MKVIGLCAWFDEPDEFLRRMVTSAAKAGVHTIVAVDGAYAQLPGAQARSAPSQAKALVAAARKAGIGIVLHEPERPWLTEVEKRNHLFRLGLACAESGEDWFFVMDADYEIHAHPEFLPRLAMVETDVAQVLAFTPKGPNGEVTFGPPERSAFRALFRAQKIELQGNHFTYVGENGQRLWGMGVLELAKSTDLSDRVGLTHWTYFRPKSRNQRQYDYYRARDKAQTERGPCVICEQVKATLVVPKFIRDEEGNVEAALIEVCDDCYGIAVEEARRKAEEWNLEELVATQKAV